MTICAISDTHGQHSQLDLTKYPADVLVHAGDWTRGRDLGMSETKEFFQWFEVQPYKYKICIAGNHEREVEVAQLDPAKLKTEYPSIDYLMNSGITIEGVNFYGSPYSNEFCNWAFMEEDAELSKIWDLIPSNTNVLITHGPAYRCNDKVKRSYGRDPHVGSQSLAYRKKELVSTLKVHISGHIHEEGSNVITNGNITNICASVLDENYNLTNKPVIISL